MTVTLRYITEVIFTEIDPLCPLCQLHPGKHEVRTAGPSVFGVSRHSGHHYVRANWEERRIHVCVVCRDAIDRADGAGLARRINETKPDLKVPGAVHAGMAQRFVASIVPEARWTDRAADVPPAADHTP